MGSGDIQIMDTLTDLGNWFTYNAGNSQGRWAWDPAGSTPSSSTGPSNNNLVAYVHTETSQPQSFADNETKGIAVLKAAQMPSTDLPSRTLRLRLVIAGQFGNGEEGLRVQSRVSGSDSWTTTGFIHGWSFANNRNEGDTWLDENNFELTCVLRGGWVDFEVTIPDDHTQLRLYPRYISPGGSTPNHHLHDIAFREAQWSWADPPPPPVIVSAPVRTPQYSIADILAGGDLRCTTTLQLLDLQGQQLADLTSDIVSNTAVVNRSHQPNGSTVGTFRCGLRQEIPWTSTLLAPSITVTNRVLGASHTWPMGVYLPTTPRRFRGDAQEFDVQAYDLLHIYQTPITASFKVNDGDNVIESMRTFLSNESRWPGFNQSFAFAPASDTFAYESTWTLTENLSYLDVANQLLATVGYRSLWTTRAGEIATEEATILLDRGTEWTVDGTSGDGQVANSSHVDIDTWATPNVWLGIEFNPSLDVPTEDAGSIYRIRNVDVGATSINIRGREVNKIVTTEASSSAALIRAVESAAEADVAASEQIILDVSPLPFIWHLTTLTVNDPQLGLHHVPVVVNSWSLPLDGGLMQLHCGRLYRVVVPSS